MRRRKERMFVVDDLYSDRTLILQYLEDNGYEVKSFKFPEEVGDQIRDCDVVIMDVQYGRERPFAGIDYIIEQIRNGVIDPEKTSIIFKSMWGRRPEIFERLQKVAKFEWWDCSEGLELTELRKILRRNRLL